MSQSLRRLVLLFLSLQCYFIDTESSAAGTETLLGIVGRDFVILGADSSVSQSIVVTASRVDKIAVLVDPQNMNANNNNQQHQQQCIVAAAAGDAADTDRLVGLLAASATMAEYEASVGCDVRFIDCHDNDDSDEAESSTTISSNHMTPPGMTVEQVARLARSQISSRLRSSTPLRVCLLVAGLQQVPERMLPSSILVPSILLPSYASEQVQHQVRVAATGQMGPASESSTPLMTTTKPTTRDTRLEPRLYWLDEYGSIQSLLYGAHGHGSNFALSILDQGYRPDLTRDQAVALMRDCFAQLRTRYVINAPQPPCIKCVDSSGCRVVV